MTINVTAAPPNNPPVFTEGASATRSVIADVPAGTSIGLPVAATDADAGDTLTYSLEGRDAASFDINTSTGQLITIAGVTLAAGDTHEVTVVASDGTDSATITVTINVAAPPNNPPVFTEGASATRSVIANVPAGTSIGQPVTATDADAGDTLTYSLEGRDAASFDINTSTGQLITIAGVTLAAGDTHEVTVVASDGTDSATITVTINVAAPPNNPPVFTEGASATRSVIPVRAPAGTSIGQPVTATDADAGDTLTYSLEGRDAASFDINTSTGQLITIAGVTLAAGDTHEVTVVASDGTDSATITVTINVAAPPNNPPVFTEGASATRSVIPVRAPAGTSIGQPVTATDADAGDTLTYSLEGRDAASFDINTSTGQLITIAGVTLAAGDTHEVTVVASDGTDSATITVTINVAAPPNNPPVFTEGASATRSVIANVPAGTSIGLPVAATDADAGDTLNYTPRRARTRRRSASTPSNGQLLTLAGVTLDRSTYTVDVVASDGTDSARITVTINVDLNEPPAFASSSTTRSVVENQSAGTNVGGRVTATDPDQGGHADLHAEWRL